MALLGPTHEMTDYIFALRWVGSNRGFIGVQTGVGRLVCESSWKAVRPRDLRRDGQLNGSTFSMRKGK
jgi:hypothetical protein